MNDCLTDLRLANTTRVTRWHPGGVTDWSLCDWANAMGGEAGEASNAIKKLRRVQDAIANKADEDARLLDTCVKATAAIGDELADVIIYADLLALRAGVRCTLEGMPLTDSKQPVPIQRRGAWLQRCAGFAAETAVMMELLEDRSMADRLSALLELHIGETLRACQHIARDLAIDLPAAITAKFNATSERYGFPERLPVAEAA